LLYGKPEQLKTEMELKELIEEAEEGLWVCKRKNNALINNDISSGSAKNKKAPELGVGSFPKSI
jgi:hypothetical protein